MPFILDNKIINNTKMQRYKHVMTYLMQVDVSTNQDFKNNYCNYYDMNKKTDQFKDVYFDYLEKNKNNKKLSYHDVLNALCNATGEVHYSFASKLLHTINPDNPILDQHVMRLLGFKQKEIGFAKTSVGKAKDERDRIDYYVKVHETIKKEYTDIANKTFNAGKGCIYCALDYFDRNFTNWTWLSTSKKIDCIVSRMKDERAPSILLI